MEQKLEKLSIYQTAYRHNKSTSDNLIILQELFFEYRFNKVGPRGGRKTLPLYFCFLDLIKAFDKVPREILFKKLYKFGIIGKIFRVIRDMYTDNIAKVLIINIQESSKLSQESCKAVNWDSCYLSFLLMTSWNH